MTAILAAYIIGVLIVASLLMAWFYTSAPCHVLHLFRRLGWKKQFPEFWELLGDEWTMTTADFEWAMAQPCVPAFISTLVQCKYCFSFHVSFWTSAVFYILSDVPLLFIPAATFSWPVLAIYLMNKVKD